MPVGGIKEKILAAKRAGIKEIILCDRNKKDIEEIDQHYLEGVEFHFVDNVSQVLKIALLDSMVDDPVQFTFEKEPGTVDK
jgi:ATP-dependent Lon protease